MSAIPDRVSMDRASAHFWPFYYLLGVRIDGRERLGDVHEFCVSEQWAMVRSKGPDGRPYADLKGRYIVQKVHGLIEPYLKKPIPGQKTIGDAERVRAAEAKRARAKPRNSKGPEVGKMSAMKISSEKQTNSVGRWLGKSVVYGKEDDHATPYMTRYWIGRLRIHIFHRGDQDPDCHDHPWDFWTFPLTPYVEEVARQTAQKGDYDENYAKRSTDEFEVTRQVVPAWRLTFRRAEHCHRVLGHFSGTFFATGRFEGWSKRETFPEVDDGPVVTLVWRGGSRRKWGFLKTRDGKWCWVDWKSYVFRNGKYAPCED